MTSDEARELLLRDYLTFQRRHSRLAAEELYEAHRVIIDENAALAAEVRRLKAALRQRHAEAVACIDNMAAQVRIALESPASMGSEDIDALVKAEDIRDAWLASEAKARLT